MSTKTYLAAKYNLADFKTSTMGINMVALTWIYYTAQNLVPRLHNEDYQKLFANIQKIKLTTQL